MTKPPLRIAAVSLAVAMLATTAAAQSPADLRSAVVRALSNNPEVTLKFHTLQAAADAQDIARSARRPRVELNADIGHDRSSFSGAATENLNRAGIGVSVTQLLWDGLGSKSEIARTGHERLGRYFDLREASEQLALEAARAHYDVLRYRQLVRLADDNLTQHKQAAQKIDARVKAGVGRGVDLEQANARLALAESNVNAERANLHDVGARYQRLVGEAPPNTLGMYVLDGGVPATPLDALKTALGTSPAISAAIENLRAARAAVSTRTSALQPRVEARLRSGVGRNYLSQVGRTSDSAAEVVLNWTLFDGGAGQARVRQQANLVHQAIDMRDKACRDARQTAVIAYNDLGRLGDQLGHLERNTQAIERARDAYRQQFDISQRSLLDLLNAENEAYTARRALANAQFDRALAYARTHAALNQLVTQLGIGSSQLAEVEDWDAGSDAAGRCPLELVPGGNADAGPPPPRMAADPNPPLVTMPVAPPAPLLAVPVPVPSAAASTPTPASAPSATEAFRATAESLPNLVNAWADAWRSKSFERYAAFYANDFAGSEASRAAWEAKRRALLGKKGAIKLTLGQPEVVDAGGGQFETRFTQRYVSSNFSDSVSKVLTWRFTDGQWLIVKESNR